MPSSPKGVILVLRRSIPLCNPNISPNRTNGIYMQPSSNCNTPKPQALTGQQSNSTSSVQPRAYLVVSIDRGNMQKSLFPGPSKGTADFGKPPYELSLNSLAGGLLCTRALQGLLRGILGVQTLNPKLYTRGY